MLLWGRVGRSSCACVSSLVMRTSVRCVVTGGAQEGGGVSVMQQELRTVQAQMEQQQQQQQQQQELAQGESSAAFGGCDGVVV